VKDKCQVAFEDGKLRKIVIYCLIQDYQVTEIKHFAWFAGTKTTQFSVKFTSISV
jgi:hypothetical protein